MKVKKTTRLRRIFESDRTELMPFGVMPIHAQMAERAGFESFHISGGMTSWWNGLPDVGLMTRTEIIDAARRIVQSVDIPVYCDADTGYGGIQNVRKTVQDFIATGVAGIHLEDQRDPKKAGGQAGIAIVSDEEAIGRLRAAVEARDQLDPDFVITARTDGYAAAGGGLEEALRRGKLYREETGVDVIFYEGIRSWDEARYLLTETPGPAYVIASRHAGPTPSVAELSQMRQAISIVPFIIPGVQELWKLLLKVRDSGELNPIDEYLDHLFELEGTEEFVGWGDAFVKPSYQDVRGLEERFLPSDQQRDYNTIHD
ncbi:isocitrate lyase/PEP mutase family protein [Rhodococcus sp. 14C212]|uniref:isocitrate lyase/PEP mutase family protein n=1 Tax=Rhodococcus sp. 14C212 TaxID=2711209 RepID=UPI0013ED69BC|nr:isocitrate lyase/PEP mutase family protein [Rhodococcus sp. 14C212]NGP09467.1 isocitrate lyase/PEP mutase family protein [Rhodococcus sp. 14C212]